MTNNTLYRIYVQQIEDGQMLSVDILLESRDKISHQRLITSLHRENLFRVVIIVRLSKHKT